MFRVGHGVDVHKFILSDENFIMLCGVKIPHTHAVLAHSDGDVAIHALVDSILGAMSSGDIGDHFPPSDPRWKNVDSSFFLQESMKISDTKGYKISNVDITIICERPKIQDYKVSMREKLAKLLSIGVGAINLKATTTEGLGCIGRGEGIAAQAVVCMYKQ